MWQFPTQHKIDQELFSRPNLVTLGRAPQLVQRDGSEARYSFTLKLGPRGYKNFVKRQKALDFEDIEVHGRIKANGRTLAWCNAFAPDVPRPNDQGHEKVYLAELRDFDVIDLEVNCEGPAAYAPESGESLSAEWELKARLLGDRETVVQSFSSTPQVSSIFFASQESRP